MPTTADPKKSPVTAPAAARQWDGSAKDLPRHALQFRSVFKFAAGEQPAGEKIPFTMTARSAEPVDSCYWGRCVHDMAGMQLTKPTLPVDYCHDATEILGYADKFEVVDGSLVVSGALTPYAKNEQQADRASEIVYKQKLGVPYEASIDFSAGSPVIEYVPVDASVQVNGKTFAGPGVVFRQWTLRAVAICPHGADPNTATEFAAADQVGITVINSPQEGTQMSKDNKPAEPTKTAPAAAAAATQLQQQPAAGTPAGEPKPQDKFITAFGDAGARWFLEGKPFEDCATEFTAKLRADHKSELDQVKAQFATEKASIQGELEAATKKLAAIGRGDAGVTFANAEGGNADPKALNLKQNLGEGIGAFAAAIKVPGAKPK
jgi:hypothetical protein